MALAQANGFHAQYGRTSNGERYERMKIILQACTALAGLFLVIGLIGLLLWNQVLAVVPTKTAPPTAEDMAELRESMRLPPSTAVETDSEFITPCTTSPTPL